MKESANASADTDALAPADPARQSLMARCRACGVEIEDTFCTKCGQHRDDFRRSIFDLAHAFIEETFGIESRMWRTLRSLACEPGAVARHYADGVRTKFTPPIRLFIIASALFFLSIAITETLFLAIDLQPRGQDEARHRPARPAFDFFRTDFLETDVDCGIDLSVRLFVRANAISNDQDAWNQCADRIRLLIDATGDERPQAISRFDQFQAGVAEILSNPYLVNNTFNTWLPRVFLIMAPVMALLIAVFVRGSRALVYDNLIFAFYFHAVWLTVATLAVVIAHANVPLIGLGAGLLLVGYLIVSIRRFYGRGWLKTILTASGVSALYLAIMVAISGIITIKTIQLVGA
ncbi:MAG: DUF3667 domain-containing protein [Pseudomonadota bacterium]